MLSENIVGAPDVDCKLRKHDPASEVDEIESVVNAAVECRQAGHGTRRKGLPPQWEAADASVEEEQFKKRHAKFKIERHCSLKRSNHHEVSSRVWGGGEEDPVDGSIWRNDVVGRN